MRAVRIDDQGVLDGDASVAVYLEGGHEVWLLNPRCTLEQIVEGCNHAIAASPQLRRVGLRRRLEVKLRKVRDTRGGLLPFAVLPGLLLLEHLPM